MKTLQKILIIGAVALKLIGAATLVEGSIAKNKTHQYIGGSIFLAGGCGYILTSRPRNY